MITTNARYAQVGLTEKALDILRQMNLTGIMSDSSTSDSTLLECTDLGALEQRK